MKFTALPVNVGDAFLLQTKDKKILVDGGQNQTDIIKLLNKENLNNHIDLLVCSHYDADHINGILGVIKSKKYTFNEIWLPEIFGSLGYSLSKKIDEIFHSSRINSFNLDYDESLMENINEPLMKDNDFEKMMIKEDTQNLFEDIDNEVLDMFINNYPRHHRRYYYELERNMNFKMFSSLLKITMLINHSLNSGAYIRWFKYAGEQKINFSYGYNLIPENAILSDITIYDEKLFFKMLKLTTLSDINKYSLVFKYEEDCISPNILFCADSDLNFYSKKVYLNDNSIITAPHHGSSSNDIAYSKINGKNLIFVRSDRSQLKRPGKGYLSQSIRYCTICRNFTSKQKVEFLLSSNSFNTKSKTCTC